MTNTDRQHVARDIDHAMTAELIRQASAARDIAATLDTHRTA